MVCHSSLANLAQSVAKTFPISHGDRVLQFSPYCFDPSLAEICGSLIVGATLCIRTEAMAGSHFFAECERLEITTLNLPTSLWYEIFAEMDFMPSSLKTVIIGGEAVKSYQLDSFFKKIKRPITLLNTYGPTETTVAVTACDLSRYSPMRPFECLIGNSFANASLHVVDKRLRLLPIGAVGELLVSGPGVSLGYYKRPDLTKEKFLSSLANCDDMHGNSGPFFKTGDRVKWVERYNEKHSFYDNAPKETSLLLAFIGRDDQQIKIRGFRVELGEIERAINSYPGVESSRVLFFQENQLDYLSAFIVPKSCTSISVLSLKSMLHSLLPAYMVPSQFKMMAKWPTTLQGKIDNIELLKSLNLQIEINLEAHTVEDRLAKIWKDLLRIDEVGSGDHFFYLGGHSLMAMRLLAAINRDFSIALTLKGIFENPQFSHMAKLIKNSRDKKVLATVHETREEAAPLTFGQEALWVFDQLRNGRSINYNIAFALHLKNNPCLNLGLLEQSINLILSRHESLRSVFPKRDGRPVQVVIDKTIRLDVETVDLAGFRESALDQARTAFDLTRDCPICFRLFSIDDDYHILLINHHHIIHDGHSIGIFLRELVECYESFFTNQSPNLGPLPMSYLDYARRQRNYSEEHFADSYQYWTKQLTDYIPWQLPNCDLSLYGSSIKKDRHRFSVDATTVKALRTLCQRENTTLFVVMLSILKVILYYESNLQDIAIATVMSIREYEQDKHLIGMFINTVILRTSISPEKSFHFFMCAVKKTLLEAFCHRLMPLEKITKTVNINRLPQSHQLFDVMVNFHHREENMRHLRSPNFSADLEFIDNKTKKFGLMFELFENNNSIDIEIDFCPDFYSPSFMDALERRYRILMNTVIKDNQKSIRQICQSFLTYQV
jgi:non-ribosomal peptide synthetase component F/acyl carrier protein